MRRFASVSETPSCERCNEHNGSGPIQFRRILDSAEFESPIDFVDYTRILPGSTIGRHEHHQNEEIYFIAAGTPLMRVSGEEARLQPGSFSVVRSGEWHELINDTESAVEILVIQVAHEKET
ncbi:MAG TPA: cupin domain-containing protein [Bryobacteraceae bacterium]